MGMSIPYMYVCTYEWRVVLKGLLKMSATSAVFKLGKEWNEKDGNEKYPLLMSVINFGFRKISVL